MSNTVKISYCEDRSVLHPCKLEKFEYQIDPYIGCEHYCYYCYVLDQAKTDWRKEVMTYQDIAAKLNEEIKGITPQTVYMGNHTDPYQPCEAVYEQTRKVLDVLHDNGFSASILTKSDLVLRDLKTIREMEDSSVSISVAFSDSQNHRIFEAKTQETARRIDALRKFKEAGVSTGALICPVIPHISDVLRIIDMLEPYADTIWIYGLSMPDRDSQNRKYIESILNQHYPKLAHKVMGILDSKDDGYWLDLAEKLKIIKADRNMDIKIHV